MRMRDWSSDVCSSDRKRLPADRTGQPNGVRVNERLSHLLKSLAQTMERRHGRRSTGTRYLRARSTDARAVARSHCTGARRGWLDRSADTRRAVRLCGSRFSRPRAAPARLRSEEHTSELQSLMRNSYYGLCLNKNNTKI